MTENIHISPENLMRRLDRLGYRRTDSAPPVHGQYAWNPPVLAVVLRGFGLPQVSQASVLVYCTLQDENRWSLQGPDGTYLPSAVLEPEVVGELSGPLKLRRDPASWDEIPVAIKNAVVAIEDKRFFTHFGVDPRALVRAAWHNLGSGSGVQGGSTITQQLAKNLLLSPQRTLRRKLAEAALALYLEWRYTKQEILTLYLNHIYMGQDGIVSIAGVKSAAAHFFGKNLNDLTRAECAMLAGIIQRPSAYSPFREPEAALTRRNVVLQRMFEEGMILEEELRQSQAEVLSTRPRIEDPATARTLNAYFVAEVIRQLISRYTEEELFRYGMSIHTTMDPILQGAAQRALEKVSKQAALVAMDPAGGRITALAGGRDFRESQFNRATQARRQPGSAFKPFVYGVALEKGFTPVSILRDEPKIFSGGPSGRWSPKNFDNIYRGTTTIRVSLAQSLNSATINLAQQLGPLRVVEFAHRLGIESPLENSLAVALGAYEVTLLELTTAYAPFANGGFRVRPMLVTAVYDADGNLLEYSNPSRHPVTDPAVAGLMTSLLESVVQEGTARSLLQTGWKRPAAGKTGTTNAGRDAWFVGYTHEQLAGVWVGDDRNLALHISGSRDALPIWASFMKETLADNPPRPFLEPQGLIEMTVDPLSGHRAVAGCPEKKRELFIAGTAPAQECAIHRAGIPGWLDRLFGSN